MKIFFLTIILISCVYFSNAQSKDETINWLTEKLNKYLETNIYFIKNIKLQSLDECTFVISYDEIQNEKTNQKIVKFPTKVHDIFYDESYNAGSFHYDSKCIEIVDKGKTYYEQYEANIYISNREDKILERIAKAFKHLSTFCPKKKEAF